MKKNIDYAFSIISRYRIYTLIHLFGYEMKKHVFSEEIKFCYCSCISSSATRKKLSIKISIDFVIDEHENPKKSLNNVKKHGMNTHTLFYYLKSTLWGKLERMQTIFFRHHLVCDMWTCDTKDVFMTNILMNPYFGLINEMSGFGCQLMCLLSLVVCLL